MASSLFDKNGLYDKALDVTYNQINSTNVLLGFPDEEVVEHLRRDVDFTTSKIGGQPVRILRDPSWGGGGDTRIYRYNFVYNCNVYLFRIG